LSYGRKAKRADLYELWAQTRALYGKIQNNQLSRFGNVSRIDKTSGSEYSCALKRKNKVRKQTSVFSPAECARNAIVPGQPSGIYCPHILILLEGNRIVLYKRTGAEMSSR